MILMILGALVSLLVPFAFYKYILKGHAEVNKKLYVKTFLLAATLYTLPIIILGITWDVIFFSPVKAETAPQCLAVAFVRAAMLEEAVKYFFTYRVLKRNQTLGMKESILLAGLVGIGYGFTEKLAYANPLALITNGLIPGHMLFQWVMGYWMYRAFRAEGSQRKKYLFLAYFVPYLIHGLWDFGLDVPDFLTEWGTAASLAGGALLIVMVVGMIAAIFIGAKKIRNIAEA